jgi:hypothetical protein
MRNEGPFLLEWVAWLRLMGVSDLLVYSNGCADGSDAMLEALAQAGVLEHVAQEPPPRGRSVQWQALKAAWAHPLRKQADWAACLDCDEFLRPLHAGTLGEFLATAPEADGHAIPWRLFGHGGHLRADHGLVSQSFLRAAPQDLSYPAVGHFVKAIFRPGGPFNGFGVHRPKQKKGAVPRWLGPDGQPLPAGFAADPGRINLWGHKMGPSHLQLNHYSLRSAESFMIKRDRGLPNRSTKEVGLAYWVERNFNTVEDAGMLAEGPALQAAVAELRGLKGVSALEAQAVAWHRARFATLMEHPEMVQLYGRLVLAAGSEAPPQSVARQLVHAYTAAVRSQPKAGAPDD